DAATDPSDEPGDPHAAAGADATASADGAVHQADASTDAPADTSRDSGGSDADGGDVFEWCIAQFDDNYAVSGIYTSGPADVWMPGINEDDNKVIVHWDGKQYFVFERARLGAFETNSIEGSLGGATMICGWPAMEPSRITARCSDGAILRAVQSRAGSSA